MSQQIFAIFRKDFMSFFRGVFGYVLIFLYLFLSGSGMLYFGNFLQTSPSGLSAFFAPQPWIWCFILPAISLKVFNEEEKGSSFEFLFVQPIKYRTIAVAKFLSVLSFATFLLMLSFVITAFCSFYAKIIATEVFCAYSGLFLMVGTMSAICAFVMFVCKNSFAGYLLGTLFLLMLNFISFTPVVNLVLSPFGIYPVTTAASLSFAANYEVFGNGQLGLAPILFFVLLCSIYVFFCCAVLWWKRKRISGWQVAVSMFFLLSAFALTAVSNNLVFHSFAADMTKDKLNTLAAESINTANSLGQKVHIKLYVSDNFDDVYPEYAGYPAYVAKTIENYAAQSANISFEIINPKPYSPETADAEEYGLEPMLDDAGTPIYFGAVMIASDNKIASVPLFIKERKNQLEQDITFNLKNLKAGESKEIIGIIAPNLPILRKTYKEEFASWILTEKLKMYYDVVRISEDTADIPPQIKTVIAINPHSFAEPMGFALDQYVLSGGNLIIAADPYSQTEMEYAAKVTPQNNILNYWLKNFGLQISQNSVIANDVYAQKVMLKTGENDTPILKKNPLVIKLEKDDLTTFDNKPLSGLNLIVFSTAGMTEKAPENSDNVEEMIALGGKTILAPTSAINRKDYTLDAADEKIADNVHLAAISSGKFLSFYEYSPIGGDAIPYSMKEGKVAVISDSDFLSNEIVNDTEKTIDIRPYLFVEKNDNMQFLLRLIAYMNNDPIIDIIKSTTSETGVSPAEMMHKNAFEKYREELENTEDMLAKTDDELARIIKQARADSSVFSAEDSKYFNETGDKKDKLLLKKRSLEYQIESDYESQSADFVFAVLVWIPLGLTLLLSVLYYIAAWFKKKIIRERFK